MPTESKPGRPFAGSSIANYLDKQIEALKGAKSQREIAGEIGYESPNLISMFKRGEARVPLDKIPLLVHRFHESARIEGIPFRFDDIHISFWWIDGWRNGYGRASACDRSVVFGEGVV